MSNIEEKLKYLSDTKEAIKTSLINQGAAIDNNDSFRSFAAKIELIGETWKVPEGFLFCSIKTLPPLDGSKLTSLTYMFQGMKKLIQAPVFNNISTKIGAAANMYDGCSALEYVGVPEPFNMKNIYTAEFMFRGCTALKEVHLISENLWTCYNFFVDCTSLTTVSMDLITSTVDAGFFRNCNELTNMTLRNFGKNNTASANFSLAPNWGDDTKRAGAFNTLTTTLMNFADRTGKTAGNLIFGAKTFSLLNSKLKACLTQKNYTFGQ